MLRIHRVVSYRVDWLHADKTKPLMFPRAPVGLTGFEPATFCFRGVFLCWIKWLLLGPISLENGGFWFLVVFVEPTGIGSP